MEPREGERASSSRRKDLSERLSALGQRLATNNNDCSAVFDSLANDILPVTDSNHSYKTSETRVMRLREWSSVDLMQVAGPHAIIDAEERRFEKSRLHGWIGWLRNILVLVPVAITWLGIKFAVESYYQLLEQQPQQAINPFLFLWQDGFAGTSWLTLSLVGTINAAVLSVIIGLVILDAVIRQYRLQSTRMRYTDKFLADVVDTITDAQLLLVDVNIQLSQSAQGIVSRFEEDVRWQTNGYLVELQTINSKLQSRRKHSTGQSDYHVDTTAITDSAERLSYIEHIYNIHNTCIRQVRNNVIEIINPLYVLFDHYPTISQLNQSQGIARLSGAVSAQSNNIIAVTETINAINFRNPVIPYKSLLQSSQKVQNHLDTIPTTMMCLTNHIKGYVEHHAQFCQNTVNKYIHQFSLQLNASIVPYSHQLTVISIPVNIPAILFESRNYEVIGHTISSIQIDHYVIPITRITETLEEICTQISLIHEAEITCLQGIIADRNNNSKYIQQIAVSTTLADFFESLWNVAVMTRRNTIPDGIYVIKRPPILGLVR